MTPRDAPNPWRLQFSVARLLACTTLVALAAWAATLEGFISIKTPAAGDVNLFPTLAAGLLLAAAVGVLIQGKAGAVQGAQVGGAVLMVAVFMVLPVFFALRAILVLLFNH